MIDMCVCGRITLDVVIECAVLVAVLAQQPESVNICKVLKLNETVYSIPVEEHRKREITVISII